MQEDLNWHLTRTRQGDAQLSPRAHRGSSPIQPGSPVPAHSPSFPSSPARSLDPDNQTICTQIWVNWLAQSKREGLRVLFFCFCFSYERDVCTWLTELKHLLSSPGLLYFYVYIWVFNSWPDKLHCPRGQFCLGWLPEELLLQGINQMAWIIQLNREIKLSLSLPVLQNLWKSPLYISDL